MPHNTWLHLTAATAFSYFDRKWPPQVSHRPLALFPSVNKGIK